MTVPDILSPKQVPGTASGPSPAAALTNAAINGAGRALIAPTPTPQTGGSTPGWGHTREKDFLSLFALFQRKQCGFGVGCLLGVFFPNS